MNAVTVAAKFERISELDGASLFQVNQDIPVAFALSQAACLAESIKAIATDGIENGIDETTAYLVQFAAGAIQALCNAAETGELCSSQSEPSLA